MADVLIEALEDGLLTITLNRPERRNALNPELLEALPVALAKAADDPTVRAVLLTGAGGTFCVGGDVGAMGSGKPTETAGISHEQRVIDLRRQTEATRLLYEIPKPTICAVEGAAAGAGLSLALACDMRVVARGAKLTTAFVKVGLSGDFGGTWLLSQLVGTAKARELYFLSPVLKGDEAAELGLVTRLVEDGTADAESRALAMALAKGPTLTLAAIKDNLNDALVMPLGDLLVVEGERHIGSARTADHKEAVAAFVGKRPAVFRGE